jgi:spore maturation protein CgeB
MKIVVFGLTISSSWGNGHATLWRGLCAALTSQKHQVVFFERNTPYYAANRDLFALNGGTLHFYDEWDAAQALARHELADADAAIVTSYCPDAIAAADLFMTEGHGLSVFYDLDTPVTLSHLANGSTIPYVGARGLADFDLVLSYTGGGAIEALQSRLGARRVTPLYGHVDPDVHRPVPASDQYRCDLSYLGTYSADRQATLANLFLAPAERRTALRFIIGGAQYPGDFPWAPNIYFVRHLPPDEHPAFFSSSRLTLNVTRKPMAEMGWCPSGRLFEAAACGTAVVSDPWQGLDTFFAPGEEIIVANNSDEAIAALDTDNRQLRRMAAAAQEHVLAEHTSDRRAHEFVAALESAASPRAELQRA